MGTDLHSLLRSTGTLSAAQASIFVEKGIASQAQKGSQVFMGGERCLKLWFVKEGILRAYRIIDGRDITFFFFFKGEFAVDFESFLTESESPLFIETLTDAEFLIFSKRSILELYKQDPHYERFGRIMAENAYLSATNRLKQYQADPLVVRYENLMNKDPELFLQIPQYHIASYLGVKPQSLSRIKHDFFKRRKDQA